MHRHNHNSIDTIILDTKVHFCVKCMHVHREREREGEGERQLDLHVHVLNNCDVAL